jgi:hypothetical protein
LANRCTELLEKQLLLAQKGLYSHLVCAWAHPAGLARVTRVGFCHTKKISGWARGSDTLRATPSSRRERGGETEMQHRESGE